MKPRECWIGKNTGMAIYHAPKSDEADWYHGPYIEKQAYDELKDALELCLQQLRHSKLDDSYAVEFADKVLKIHVGSG